MRDFSFGSVVAGFVAVLVGYTSSAVIVFEAARAAGATPAQTASWMWALGLGMGKVAQPLRVAGVAAVRDVRTRCTRSTSRYNE